MSPDTTITDSLYDELCSFVSEVKAVADLISMAADNEEIEVDDETIAGISQALYGRAHRLKQDLLAQES